MGHRAFDIESAGNPVFGGAERKVDHRRLLLDDLAAGGIFGTTDRIGVLRHVFLADVLDDVTVVGVEARDRGETVSGPVDIEDIDGIANQVITVAVGAEVEHARIADDRLHVVFADAQQLVRRANAEAAEEA